MRAALAVRPGSAAAPEKTCTRNKKSEFPLRQQVDQTADFLCRSRLSRLFMLPSFGLVFAAAAAAAAQGSRAAPG